MTPREAVIHAVRDMLDDEEGRNFVEAAVTAWSFNLVAYAEKNPPLSERDKEHLTFARLILDDGREAYG